MESVFEKWLVSQFFFLSVMTSLSQGWSKTELSIEGILREIQMNHTITYPDGKKEFSTERKFVLIPDQPIVMSRSIVVGGNEAIIQQKSLPHLLIAMKDEFLSLIGKRVKVEGDLQRPYDFFFCDEAELGVDTILDCEWIKTHKQKKLSYEPQLVTITGKISQKTYPGPPEYSSIDQGDIPETVLILALEDPVDVENKDGFLDDGINEIEKGVREIQIVFLNEEFSSHFLNRNITVKGSLFHAHTAHHRRRVLMMANHWEIDKPQNE